MSVTFGQQISWTGRDRSKSAVTVKDYPTHQEALDAALKSAMAFGWTPPRWWQWWRWGDQDYTSRQNPTLEPVTQHPISE